MSNLNLLIDGLAYSLQSFGGVITYWDNLIENLLKLGVKPTIILHYPNNFPVELQSHIKIIDSQADYCFLSSHLYQKHTKLHLRHNNHLALFVF